MAQTEGFKYYCPLDTVKAAGFYNIELTPELNAYLKTDYSDLRIVNDSGKWVPHEIHIPAQERTNNSVIWYLKFNVIENSRNNTILLIEPQLEVISNLGLEISNTVAERFCTLSGSNDKLNWFVINDSILVNPVPDETATQNTFRIDFPPSNYQFFKIVIKNNNKDPFDIKKVVEYGVADKSGPKRLIENPATNILQKDSGKISYIKVVQAKPYHIGSISLTLSRVKYFSRRVEMYIPDGESHSFSTPGKLLANFNISNNSTLNFGTPINNAPVFYLLIYNEDNLPVKVESVKTASVYGYVTTYLEKGDKYKLIMNNKEATAPQYDISRIHANLPASIPLLAPGKVSAFEEIKNAEVPAKNYRWVLWACLIAALGILLFFTKKMVKEVDLRKKNDSI